MFYNIPYEKLSQVRLDDIRTHSFIEKEIKLLQYVRNRSLVDIDKAEMDFSIYEKDVLERHIRIPKLKELYEREIAGVSEEKGHLEKQKLIVIKFSPKIQEKQL